jgi:hypothetical protein
MPLGASREEQQVRKPPKRAIENVPLEIMFRKHDNAWRDAAQWRRILCKGV